MNADPQIQALEHTINALISAEPDLFLVEVRIRPTNNVKVFIDGDQGVSIERLVQYNRRLYKQIEESHLFPGGDFSLEVSSPGLDEPLKIHRQYLKNIGRSVEVLEKEGAKREGKLLNVTESGILVEEEKAPLRGKKNKEREPVLYEIPFEHIKSTKIQIKF